MATPKTVAFHTLGCKLNFSETSTLAEKFRERGYGVVDLEDGPDIFVLNTCSVTDFADRKCRKVIRQVQRANADSRVVVTGCYAQLKPEEIARIDGVDLVLGAGEKFRIVDYVEQLGESVDRAWIHAGAIEDINTFNPSWSIGDRTRSFLKVQDGCDYKCSFCTIPQARGKSRSSSVQDVVDAARQLGRHSIREIVLTGVNIGDFGGPVNGAGKSTFLDLISALNTVEEVARFRISSIEPNLCSDPIIEFVASSNRFMPHFHMPLQSGNDKQLRMMRRRYKRDLYSKRVDKIKSEIPHACIGVDVIVGFPGETDSDFRETCSFLEDLDISYLHVFTYSERANTPAAEMTGSAPMHTRRDRSNILRELSEKKRIQFYNQFAGNERQVLLEHTLVDDCFTGFTDNYIKVMVPASVGSPNQIIPVKLESFDPVLKMMTSGFIPA